MKLLVTGGAGFIGSNFVRHAVQNTAHEVVNIDALTYAGSKSNLEGILGHPDHEFVKADITDRSLINSVMQRVDAVINFAAESHVDRSITGAGTFVQTNVEGTQILLESAADNEIDRFIQVSTDEVYGEIIDGKFTEKSQLNPRNPYAATKAAADLLAQSYHTTHDVPVIITRSSNNYGPRQHEEKLIPKVIRRASQGDTIPVYGDGSNVREWTYVDDNVRAIETVLESGDVGAVYNVGSGTELENIEVVRRIIDSVDASEDLIEFVDDRPGHDQRYALETRKIEEIGWSPQVSFDRGLERTLQYYLRN